MMRLHLLKPMWELLFTAESKLVFEQQMSI